VGRFGLTKQSLPDSIARTEMHHAWTQVALADAYSAQRRYKEANGALLAAEGHYSRSKSAMTVEQTDAILDELTEDVRVRLDRIRVAIKIFLRNSLAEHSNQ
jgi:hypothetical protein